jgi:hypothetical protein
MSSPAEKSTGVAQREGSRGLRDELERFARHEAELASSIDAVLAGDHLDEKSVAQLLRARCSATRDGLTLLFQWMDQLDRRIRQIDSRVSGLATRASDQQEALRMMCSVIQEIDDPYGFGLSLDERILGETAQGPSDDRE